MIARRSFFASLGAALAAPKTSSSAPPREEPYPVRVVYSRRFRELERLGASHESLSIHARVFALSSEGRPAIEISSSVLTSHGTTPLPWKVDQVVDAAFILRNREGGLSFWTDRLPIALVRLRVESVEEAENVRLG